MGIVQEQEEARKMAIPGWEGDTVGRLQLPTESFGEYLDAKAGRNAHKVFMYFEDQAVSYWQLRDRVARVADGMIDLGVKNQDKVAIMMLNRPEYIYSWFAVDAIGAVYVPVNVALKGQGLVYILNQSDSETLIVEQQLYDSVKAVQGELVNMKRIIVLQSPGEERPAGAVSFEDLYLSPSQLPYVRRKDGDMLRIMFTSGTTGLPKGTVRRHPGPARQAIDDTQKPFVHKYGDLPYVFLPLFHALAQGSTTTNLALEGTMAMAQRFSARRFWPDVRKYGCNRFTFAGSIGHILLKQPPQPDDADNPVEFGEGWTPLRDLKAEFESRFKVTLYERYATSDGGGGTMNLPDGRCGSIGKGVTAARINKIVDEHGNECPPHVIGEIVTKPLGPAPATVEYYKMPDASKQKVRDGWFHTGDFGYRDEDGYLFFSDRERQFIRRAGENISSQEVERVVDQHPDVLESAASGVRAEVGGEQEVKISLVPQPGRKVNPEELVRFCEERMAYYMVPRYVDIRDSLPKTETHRVQKFKLVDEGVTASMWDREAAGYKLKR